MSKILVVGDVMIDRYIVGNADRISPEAPVPVVRIHREYSTLGGAANVSHNLSRLRISNDLFGAIGPDDYGVQLSRMIDDLGIGNRLKPILTTTITKTRVVSRGQQMLRIDREDNASIPQVEVTWDEAYEAVILSDYDKGFCQPDVCNKLISMAGKKGIPVFVDPKGKNWSKYQGSFVVKPNIKEMEDVLGRLIPNEDQEIETAGLEVITAFGIKNLIITRGDKGMSHLSSAGIKHHPVRKVDVFDVSGAGDTAIAVLAKEYLESGDLDNAITMANKASSFVVTKPQTYAISLEEYLAL